MFDAEHFFDGYKSNPKYSIEVIKTAFDAGANGLFYVIQMAELFHLSYNIFDDVKKVIPLQTLEFIFIMIQITQLTTL